ncbi:MAG TPA: TraB/GumN family protein [Gammaproteobacteria bacterium]|nr:TraB/GumN family protein [Gammaproteobacteria bacterium]
MIQIPVFFLWLLLLNLPAYASEGKPEFCARYDSQQTDTTGPQKDRDSIPYGKGLLWKIETSSGNSSYIFGTMHSQDRLVTGLPPKVRLALINSNRLVMEVVSDEEANRIFNESIYFKNDSSLRQMVDDSIYQRIETLLPEYGIEKNRIDKVKPWAAFTLLGRPKPVRAPTQDANIRQLALAHGIPVTGIERMDELLDALENLSRSDQIEILNNTVCNRGEILHGALELLHLYINRDLAGIVLFNEQPHYDEAVFDRFMDAVLYGRNNTMLKRIEPYLQDGGAFIAVGALHLPDKKGLLNRLAEKGYKIEMIY